jgi:ankyrin repeat protein
MSESDGNRRQALWRELSEFCMSDSLSEDGLRESIERHRLEPTNNLNISNYDFFLMACQNKWANEGIIRCLLEYFPAAISATDNEGRSPLHLACSNENITLDIVQLLIDAAPDSVRTEDNYGRMPIHRLCCDKIVDEIAAMEILKLLLEKCPESVRHADNLGELPIHEACRSRSPEYCRVLIEKYPGSERIANNWGMMPLHFACWYNSVATVEYLYKLHPGAIYHISTNGDYPIHYAIDAPIYSENPAAAVDVVKFLLDCDPNVKLQKLFDRQTSSLLHYACDEEYDDSNIEAGIQVIKIIYDAHPKAIEDNRFTSNFHHHYHQVQTFISSQLVYSRQASDHRLMTTPNEKGKLPLHTALQNNVRLGSIKLLVKGNPSAIRTFDISGVIPLHVACQHHQSATVVEYLIELDTTTLDTVDREGNTALHHACLGAKHDTIALLLEKYDAVSVSKQNANKKLPIDLLWESDEVEDRESIEYTESVFRLLKAYPETVMSICTHVKKQSTSAACTSSIEKKWEFAYELFDIAKAIVCPKMFRAK